MSVSDYNQGILAKLRGSVTAFAAGELDLDQIQAELQSSLGLLEEIRFTRLLDEQRPAVTFRLDELLETLPGDES